MSGLQRICKLYGRMKIQGVMWAWDYARDIAVKESEMTKAQWKASERAKYSAPDVTSLDAPPGGAR